MLLVENDNAFFRRNRNRQIRIRRPHKGEMNREFLSLGVFPDDWRRMIVWKVPNNVRAPFSQHAGQLIRIPYVKRPEEEIDDTDKRLMPLLEELMQDANREQGIAGKA